MVFSLRNFKRPVLSGSGIIIIVLFFLSFFLSGTAFSQKAIFLHHSTGEGVWNGGDGNSIPDLLMVYNNAENTAYEISERAYPTGTYPWENYPYDYWNLWVNGACDSEASTECLSGLCMDYDLIIYKHCFPGAGIVEDNGDPNVSSSTKTLGNYKAQYRALRTVFDGYPDTKFMVWTLAPLHRLATNSEDAARAREFVNWVKNDWLSEDGKAHPNIYIFDFFAYAAEQSAEPENGQTNCLRYEYEGSHTGSDSHPNSLANATIAPIFFQAIINTFNSSASGTGRAETEAGSLYPNPASGSVMWAYPEQVQTIAVYSAEGKLILKQPVSGSSGMLELNGFRAGLYFVVTEGKGGTYSGKLLLR